MESTASCWMRSVLFFHFSLLLGTAVQIKTSSSYSSLYEKTFLPCRKEELQCGNGFCLMNWLLCHYRKGCGKEYVSITVTCSEIHLNHSNFISKITHYTETSRGTIMLDSSVLVAGVVIGVVLFLSCVAILIGSLRKNQCFRHLQLWRDASYTPDCFSYGGSVGELRSSCTEEFQPTFYFSSYMEALSQANITHPDSPPRYDECVGPGAAQIYLPTEDPPPYSLIDPCQQNDVAINNPSEERGFIRTTTRRDPEDLGRVQDLHQPSISFPSSFPTDTAPPYEVVACEQNIPLPQIPPALLKDLEDHHQTLFNRIM
ncbi:protein BEAN1 [Candoia aspera]|uniref:protein BEAN1 n=1 Tax=Candoia aspera TaxID=51853 RepID=UPI002FD802BF